MSKYDFQTFNKTVCKVMDLLAEVLPPSPQVSEILEYKEVCVGNSSLILNKARPILAANKDSLLKGDVAALGKLSVFADLELQKHVPNIPKDKLDEAKQYLRTMLQCCHLLQDEKDVTKDLTTEKASSSSSTSSSSSSSSSSSTPVVEETKTKPTAAETKKSTTLSTDEYLNKEPTEKEKKEFKQMVDRVLDDAMEKMGRLMGFRDTTMVHLKKMVSKHLSGNAAMNTLRSFEYMNDPDVEAQIENIEVKLKDDEKVFFHAIIFNLVLLYTMTSIRQNVGSKIQCMQPAFEKANKWLREHYRSDYPFKRFLELCKSHGEAAKQRTLFPTRNNKNKEQKEQKAASTSAKASTTLEPIKELEEFGIYELARRAPPAAVDRLYEYVESFQEVEAKCNQLIEKVPEVARVLVVWIKNGPLDTIREEMKQNPTKDLPEVMFTNLFKTLEEKKLHKEFMIVLKIMKDESKIHEVMLFFSKFIPILSTFMNQSPLFNNAFGMKR